MVKKTPVAPVVLKGALVQLIEEFGVPIPNIVPFQYNPAKITRAFTPWNPFAATPQNQAAQAPQVQPFDPEEKYTFDLEFDATEDVEWYNAVAMATGVASRIAALKKLIEPSKGLIGDLVGSAKALGGTAVTNQATRPTVPITLLILGTAVIVPVRVTSLSIEITEFTPLLYPWMAKATIEVQVVTPDAFKCRETSASVGIAKAAYNLTALQEDALAIANLSNVGTAVASMIPI